MNAETVEFFRAASKLKGDESVQAKVYLGSFAVSFDADRFTTKAVVERNGDKFYTFYVSTRTAFVFSGEDIYKGYGIEEASATLIPKELREFYGVRALVEELFGVEAKT